jgi:hypothetical protein
MLKFTILSGRRGMTPPKAVLSTIMVAARKWNREMFVRKMRVAAPTTRHLFWKASSTRNPIT